MASISEIVERNSSGLLGLNPAWSRVKLGDIAQILNGFAFPSNKFSKDSGKPLLRIRDILSDKTEAYFNGGYDPNYLIQHNDLVVGMDGDFNCALWKGQEALLNQRVCKLTPDEKFYLRKFLSSVLPGYLKAINSETSSVTVKHLSSFTLADLPLPLPPVPEQHRIVAKIEELFTKLDAGVEALKKVKAQLKRYRQAVLKYAFEGKLTQEWREANKHKLEAASVLLERIKEERKKKAEGKFKELLPVDTTNLPEVPEGWVWTRIGEISKRIQYGTSEKAEDDSRGIPVIRMGNIFEGKISFDNLKYFDKEWPHLNDFLLKDGDVLFNRTNSMELVGKTAVYKKSNPEAIFASYLIRVGVDKDSYNPDLLSVFINSFYGRKYISSVVSQQVGQANVNGTKLSMMPIPLPSFGEQKKIVEEIEARLSMADYIEKTAEQTLMKSERLRQSVLKMAFEGKLVPQDPTDEPAEKLLERIKAEKTKKESEIKGRRKKSKQMELK